MRAAALPDGGYAVVTGTADTIDVVPGRPVPDAGGPSPAVRIWELGAAAVLQLGVLWPVAEQWLRANARPLFGIPQITGSATRLQVAVTGSPTLTINTFEHVGSAPEPLTVVTTSGYPPYSAIVSIELDSGALDAVRAAAAGQHGRAFATITATLAADLPLVRDVLARTALVIDTTGPEIQVSTTSDLADWASTHSRATHGAATHGTTGTESHPDQQPARTPPSPLHL